MFAGYNQFISICEECGIPIKMEKTHFPTSISKIYRIQGDSYAIIQITLTKT